MHKTNRLIREGEGLLSSSALNLSAMNVQQVIGFFGELLGKSEAAFNSAGVVGKLFYGIITLVLKGLNMIGSWVTSLTNWLVSAMGGIVPGAGNLTYAQLLIYAAICAVLVWGLRRVWRRIRGRHSYYENVEPLNQKRLYLQIKEDIRTIDRMTILNEMDVNSAQPQAAAPQAQPAANANNTDTKNIGICSKIVGFICRMAKDAQEITVAFAKDVYGPQSRYKQNKDASFQDFANLASAAGSGVNGFLAKCVDQGNPESFRSKLMYGAFVNRNILDKIVKGAAFYAFPGLTALWFGNRVVSERIVRSPTFQRMLQSKVEASKQDNTYLSKVLRTFSGILYDKNWQARSRSEVYSELVKTARQTYSNIKGFIGTKPNWGQVFKSGISRVGSAIGQGVVYGVAGTAAAAVTAAKLGAKGAKAGLTVAKNAALGAGSAFKSAIVGNEDGGGAFGGVKKAITNLRTRAANNAQNNGR